MLSLVPPSVPPAQPLPALTPARGVRRARVALLAGCAQQVLAPGIGAAAIRVLSQCGVEVVVPRGQGCCGALALHVGDRERARQRARVNVAAFPDDVDAVVTTAAAARGCRSRTCSRAVRRRGRRRWRATPSTSACSSSARRDARASVADRSPSRIDAISSMRSGDVAEATRAPRRISNVRLVGSRMSTAAAPPVLQPRSAGAGACARPAQGEGVLATGASIVASSNVAASARPRLTSIAGADAPRVVHTIELVDEALARG
jgi:glycolate oxidase iron-sulfur subunit